MTRRQLTHLSSILSSRAPTHPLVYTQTPLSTWCLFPQTIFVLFCFSFWFCKAVSVLRLLTSQQPWSVRPAPPMCKVTALVANYPLQYRRLLVPATIFPILSFRQMAGISRYCSLLIRQPGDFGPLIVIHRSSTQPRQLKMEEQLSVSGAKMALYLLWRR